MKFIVENRMDFEQVYSLLVSFDNAFSPALSSTLSLKEYGEKLSKKASFILAKDLDNIVAFIAYYVNEAGNFCYIPLLAVIEEFRHKGIGQKALMLLEDTVRSNCTSIRLEVLKSNDIAWHFYSKEGFVAIEDRYDKLLLEKEL